MAHNLVLALLEVFALASCIWGLRIVWTSCSTNLAMMYNSAWFLIGSLANLIGIISVYMTMRNPDDPGATDLRTANAWLHRHYFLCWLTIVIGYPFLVTSFLTNYYDSPWINALLALPVIPLAFWEFKPNRMISVSTQIVTLFLIPAQAWVPYKTSNWPGLYGAATMIVNLLALSIPTSYNVFGLTPREIFIIGLGVCSIFFLRQLMSFRRTRLASAYQRNDPFQV